VKRLQHANLSAPLSLVVLSWDARWQTGDKALCLYSQFPQACKPVCRAPTSLTTASMEWNPLHMILVLGCVADIVSVTMSLFSIKGLAVAIFHHSGVC